jgi:hypothetical protein
MVEHKMINERISNRTMLLAVRKLATALFDAQKQQEGCEIAAVGEHQSRSSLIIISPIVDNATRGNDVLQSVPSIYKTCKAHRSCVNAGRVLNVNLARALLMVSKNSMTFDRAFHAKQKIHGILVHGKNAPERDCVITVGSLGHHSTDAFALTMQYGDSNTQLSVVDDVAPMYNRGTEFYDLEQNYTVESLSSERMRDLFFSKGAPSDVDKATVLNAFVVKPRKYWDEHMTPINIFADKDGPLSLDTKEEANESAGDDLTSGRDLISAERLADLFFGRDVKVLHSWGVQVRGAENQALGWYGGNGIKIDLPKLSHNGNWSK